jgi:hypothetical protein
MAGRQLNCASAGPSAASTRLHVKIIFFSTCRIKRLWYSIWFRERTEWVFHLEPQNENITHTTDGSWYLCNHFVKIIAEGGEFSAPPYDTYWQNSFS